MSIVKYHHLTKTETEDEFFEKITNLLMDKYNNLKNNKEPIKNPIIIYVNVTVPINNLFYYKELCSWFIKTNFKYIFYKKTQYTPITLYIDHILINKYFISNEIIESPINNYFIHNFNETRPIVNFIYNTLIKPFINLFLYFIYSKEQKAYITMQFIIREPR